MLGWVVRIVYSEEAWKISDARVQGIQTDRNQSVSQSFSKKEDKKPREVLS